MGIPGIEPEEAFFEKGFCEVTMNTNMNIKKYIRRLKTS